MRIILYFHKNITLLEKHTTLRRIEIPAITAIPRHYRVTKKRIPTARYSKKESMQSYRVVQVRFGNREYFLRNTYWFWWGKDTHALE